jgi:hypothetical protein
MKMPECFMYMTADAVAECFDGVSKEMSRVLWSYVSDAEKAGTAHPRGGDGSDGTVEEPIITNGEYASDMAFIWVHLSDEQRAELILVAEKNRVDVVYE